MKKKLSVKKAFSRNAHKYDEYALVQKQLGKALSEKVEPIIKALSTSPKILDIGSGTGNFTKEIHSRIKKSGKIPKATCLDISENMLKICKKQIPSARIVIGDMDSISSLTKETYELIISNATLQWTENLESLIKQIYGLLATKGFLCFSIFTQGTLCSLANAIYSVLQIETPAMEFVSYNSVANCLVPYFHIKNSGRWSIELEFDTLFGLLKYIKNTGTYSHQTLGRQLTKRDIQRIESAILKEDKKITAVYKAGLFICQKQ